MRIALDHTSEIGVRAGRLLLGEPGLDLLGIVRRPVKDSDARLKRVSDISEFDALVCDDPESSAVGEAALAGVPCALLTNSLPAAIDVEGFPALIGANLVTGIGRSLVEQESTLAGPGAEVLFAWTEMGKPRRRGEPLTFPEPVGARWGTRRTLAGRRLEVAAPVEGDWAGILVRTATHDTTRTVGIADLATHLEAIALAAGAIVAASGLVPIGVHRPEALADDYLRAALRIGLGIASFTTTE
jgi:hypothetical protein